jgi:hypothetical protein
VTAAAGFYGSSIGKQLGLTDHASAYDHFWKSRGFIPVGPNGETQSIQSMLSQKANREAHKGFIVEKIHEHFIGKDAVTAATVSAGIPLMYDPEILDLLNASTPALAQFPQVGWNGTGYRGMNIAARGAALGFLTEAESMNISTRTPQGFTPGTISEDMVIQVGMVSVSDYGERAAAHQFSLADTALGIAITENLQLQEQAVLYGDPAQEEDDYGIGDAQAPEGFAKKFSDASAATDKSTTSLSASDALLKDIKAELKDLCSTYNVSPTELYIVTSYDVHDELDNELNVHGRTEVGQGEVNYGAERLKVWGVPVIPCHNVKTQTARTTYAPGSSGDVFIFHRRAHIVAALAPWFMLPLGRRGLSDEWVMASYYTPVDRSNGVWGKYLYNYGV